MAKFGEYYIDGDNLGNATAVFSNEKMTTLAPEGYYSDGNITRYFNTTGKGPELILNGSFQVGSLGWDTIPFGNGNFTTGQVIVTTGGAPGQTKLFNSPGQEILNLFPVGQVEFYFQYAVSATTGSPTLQYFNGTNFVDTNTSASEDILFTSTNTIDNFQINIASSSATDTITITNLSFRQKVPIGLSGNLDCPLCTVDCAVQPLITTPNNAAGIAKINTKFGSATGAIKVTVNTSKPIGLFLKNQTSSNTYNEFVDANDGLNVTANPSALSYYYGGGYTDTCTNWDNDVLNNPPVFQYNINTGVFDFVGNNPTSSTSNKVSVGSDEFLSLVTYVPKTSATDFVLEGQFAFPCGGDEDVSNYANIQISCPSPLPSLSVVGVDYSNHAGACASSSIITRYVGQVSSSAGRNNVELNDIIYASSDATGGIGGTVFFKVAGSEVGSAAANASIKTVDRIVTEIQDC